MKTLLALLLLTACASRFNNFDQIRPGMTRGELRDEMTLVEGLIAFPPYEFRSYSKGLVLLKDDVVLNRFPSKAADSWSIEVSASTRPQRDDPRYFIKLPAETDKQGATVSRSRDQLALLLRVRGYTVVADAEKAQAFLTLRLSTTFEEEDYVHKLELVADAPKHGELWKVTAIAREEEPKLAVAAPQLMAAAVDFIQVSTREPKDHTVRSTNANLQVLLHRDEVLPYLETKIISEKPSAR